MRKVAVLSLLLSSLPGQALAACEQADPVAFARSFYERHRDFYFTETPQLDRVVTPALHRALRGHYRCAKKHGTCHLDYDPWLGAQDGEIDPPVAFSLALRREASAFVTMRYRYQIAAGQPVKHHQLGIQLRTAPAPQCWQVDDLVTPLGDSLATRYLDPQ